jgi:hypothetical protein
VAAGVAFDTKELFDFIDEFNVTDTLRLIIRRDDAEYFGSPIKFNGAKKFDGTIKFNGIESGIMDELVINTNNTESDEVEINDTFFIGMRKHRRFNGAHKFDGSIQFDAIELIPIG